MPEDQNGNVAILHGRGEIEIYWNDWRQLVLRQDSPPPDEQAGHIVLNHQDLAGLAEILARLSAAGAPGDA